MLRPSKYHANLMLRAVLPGLAVKMLWIAHNSHLQLSKLKSTTLSKEKKIPSCNKKIYSWHGRPSPADDLTDKRS